MSQHASPARARSSIKMMLVSAFSALILATLPAHAQDTATVEVFPAVDMDGNQTSLTPYLMDNKWTLLKIWATWCHVCQLQKPAISALHDKHRDGDNLRVIGLSIDGVDNLDTVTRDQQKNPASYPTLVADYDQVFNASFQSLAQEPLRGTPTYMVFNRNGELLAMQSGMLAPDIVEGFIASQEPGIFQTEFND